MALLVVVPVSLLLLLFVLVLLLLLMLLLLLVVMCCVVVVNILDEVASTNRLAPSWRFFAEPCACMMPAAPACGNSTYVHECIECVSCVNKYTYAFTRVFYECVDVSGRHACMYSCRTEARLAR
jgi:hypothetical protein